MAWFETGRNRLRFDELCEPSFVSLPGELGRSGTFRLEAARRLSTGAQPVELLECSTQRLKMLEIAPKKPKMAKNRF